MQSFCNFSCCFDIKKDILLFIQSLRDKLPPQATASDGKPDVNVRIIGQERYNELLFVWDDVSSLSQDMQEEVTHIGLYDLAKQKNSVLFIHEKKLNIVSCTMNQERSMIAYVTFDGPSRQITGKDFGSQAEAVKTRLSPFRVYRAFLAEILPQHRIFDLNVERRNILRVQFLWNRQPKDRDTASRESKLLLFLHKESVGLYTLPLARMGNKTVMMSGPPDTLQVLKQFIWAQWDVANQRLFVVLMKSRPSEEKQVPILRCLEFNSKASSVTKILELMLPFPITYNSGREHYSHISPSRTISGSTFNMEVIVQSNGSFCVCYQHPTKPKVQTPPTHLGYPNVSTVHTRESPFIDSETDSDMDSTGGLSTEQSGIDPRLDSNPISRRRAVSDISDLSFSSSSLKLASFHTPKNLELSSDPSSLGSSAEVFPRPITPDHPSVPHRDTRSPFSLTPKTPSSAFSSPLMWGERELPSPIPTGEKKDLVDLNYSVLVLHHMTVLHCSVPQIPRVLAENTKLYFMPLESYILVLSPGHLIHLLNVSPEVVPCLHIAFHELNDVPASPVLVNKEAGASTWYNTACKKLTHLNSVKTRTTSSDCIYNVETGKAFRIAINKDVIPDLLVQANCHSVKLALVHLVTVHLRDSMLVQKMMKKLSSDVMDLDLSELLAEHLMGATFSASRRLFDRDTLGLLQFTNTDTSRGQLIETTEGERLASFRHGSYTMQPQVYVYRKDWMERRLTMEVSSSNLWETLEQRVRSFSSPSDPSVIGKPAQRFHPRTIDLEIRKQRAQSLVEGSIPRPGPTQRPSFLKKMAASARRVMTSTKKPVITMPSGRDQSWVLMEEDTSLPDVSQDSILSLTLERLISHLERFSPASVRPEKIINMAQEYLACQLQQVKQLVLLMLHSCGYPDPRTIPRSTITLNKEPPPMDHQLFHLIERFYMAIQSICFPVPPGFQTFFTIQGFRCLEPSMFLQYVDHGILRLTEEFMTRLIHEVPDDTDEKVNMKIQIISRLSKSESEQTLHRWNHPMTMQYLAQQYVADVMKEDSVRASDSRNRRSVSQSSGNSDGYPVGLASTFPPLSTLLRLLESKDPNVGSATAYSNEDPLRAHQPDPALVEKVALRHTVQKYGSDLSAVAF